jgi:hypothetical protein
LHQTSGNPTNSHLAGKQEELANEMMNFALQSIFNIAKGSLTRSKVLRHAAYGFASPPKEGVQRILSPLKIHRHRPDLNQRTMNKNK